jgi:hypothetical protein
MLIDQRPPQHEAVRKPGRGFRIYMAISSTAILAAAIYTGLTFYSRRQENQALQEKAAEQRRTDDQRALDMMGGNTFDILSFYVSPGHIRRGDAAQLCYGVSNAKTVSLDPKDANVYPALSNCETISPRKTTTYTLTATDAQGNNKTATLTLTVK